MDLDRMGTDRRDTDRMHTGQFTGLSDRLRRAVGQSPADSGLGRLGPLVRAVGRGRRGVIPPIYKGFPFTAPTWPTSVPREQEPSELGVDYDTAWARKPAARLARRAVVEGLMRPGVGALASPRIAGEDRLDGLEGPVIFAANHHSHLDTFLLLTALPLRFRKRAVVAAGADYFFDKRWKAAFSALAIGAIPIERHKVNRASSDRAQQLLRAGWNLVIFPEGGRSPDGWASEFKAGAAFLAVRTGFPVVPVHIEGTSRVLPKGKSLPSPGEVTVTYGFPVHPTADDDARSLSERVERAIAMLADEETSGWWVARRNAANGTTPRLQGPEGVKDWRRAWALGAKEATRDRPKRSWP